MFGISLGSESNRSSQSQSGFSRNTFTRGTWDTLDSLASTDRTLNEFDLNSVISEANDRAAIDSMGAVDNIFRKYREAALPEIFNAQTSTGAFRGSTSQLLANDAYSRTVNQAAELQLGVASSYINQSLQGRDQLLQQFSQLLQANLSSTGSERNFNVGTGTGTGSGRSMQAGLNMGGTESPDSLTRGGGSDIRIKQNIKIVGKYESLGVNRYHFRYKSDPTILWEGVMAQDLLQRDDLKHAVHTDENGYYWVDYTALGIAMVQVDSAPVTEV